MHKGGWFGLTRLLSKDGTNGTNEQQEGKECQMRRQEVKNMKGARIFMTWFGIFLKLLEVKVHYHEIEVCHMSCWFRTTMN